MSIDQTLSSQNINSQLSENNLIDFSDSNTIYYFYNNLSNTKRRLLYYFFSFLENVKRKGRKFLDFSQAYVAKHLKCSREWVNKIVKEFFEIGAINKVTRHRKTCLYEVDPRICRFLREKSSHKDSHQLLRNKNSTNTPSMDDNREACSNTKQAYEEVNMPEDLLRMSRFDPETACTLAAFPKQIRESVMERCKEYQTKYGNAVNIPNFLIKSCLNLSKKLSVKPNWSKKGILLKKFGLYNG